MSATKGITLLIGLATIGYGCFERYQLSAAKSSGASAVVESVSDEEMRTSRGGGRSYSAQFQFVTAEGRQVSGRRNYREDLVEDLRASRPVKVFYDPKAPEGFVLEKAPSPWGVIFMGATVIVIALAMGRK